MKYFLLVLITITQDPTGDSTHPVESSASPRSHLNAERETPEPIPAPEGQQNRRQTDESPIDAVTAEDPDIPDAESMLRSTIPEICRHDSSADLPIDANFAAATPLPSAPEDMLNAPARLSLFSLSDDLRDRLVNQDVPARAATLAYGPLELAVHIPWLPAAELDAVRLWIDGKQTHPSTLRPLRQEMGTLDGISTLNLHYQWSCPPLGRHGIQVTYLRGDSWSVISQPVRFEILEPTAPQIIAIGVNKQSPRPVMRKHATPVSGLVKLKLAGPHPGDKVAIEINEQEVTTATVDAECCVTVHLYRRFPTGRYKLAVRSISASACGLTSKPSIPHWIDLYDHESQVSRIDLIGATLLTLPCGEPLNPPMMAFLPGDYPRRTRKFCKECYLCPGEDCQGRGSRAAKEHGAKFQPNTHPPNGCFLAPSHVVPVTSCPRLAVAIGQIAEALANIMAPSTVCQGCGANCDVNCNACLQCGLWRTKAAEPASILTENVDDLRQRATVTKARVESLAAQLDRLVAHATVLNRENISLRKSMIGHLSEVEGAVGEQLKLFLMIEDRHEQVTRSCLRLRALQVDLHDPELEFAVHEAERDVLKQVQAASALEGKLQKKVCDNLAQNFEAVEGILNFAILPNGYDSDCQNSGNSHSLNTEKQIIVASTLQTTASQRSVDFSPAIELLLQEEAYRWLVQSRTNLATRRQSLDDSLQKCERDVALLLEQLRTQQQNAIADVLDAERAVNSVDRDYAAIARLAAILEGADAALVVAQQKLAANTVEGYRAELSNEVANAARHRTAAAAEYAMAMEKRTHQIAGDKHLKEQTRFILNAKAELRRLLNGLAACIASQSERQRGLSRSNQQLQHVARDVKGQIEHLEAHREFLDIVIKNASAAIERRETLSTEAGRMLYMERMHEKARTAELQRRLRYQQDTVNAQLAGDQARADAAETLAQLHWQHVQARKRAEDALRKFAPPTITFFHAPAHFPLPRFGNQGLDDARDGMVIAEGMKLVTKADGTYEVEYKVLRSELPAKLVLQIHFKTSPDTAWETLTLNPQQIRPGSLHREYADDATELLANLSEDRFVTFTDKGSHPKLRQYGGRVVDVRRTGNARFGYGFKGLDVYGHVARGAY